MYDDEHGSPELLSKLVMERLEKQGSSPEFVEYVRKRIRGELRRKKGHPRGSAQDNPLTRFHIYAKIVRWKESGMSLERAYRKIADVAGRTPRVIRQYYEEFKNPPPVKKQTRPPSAK